MKAAPLAHVKYVLAPFCCIHLPFGWQVVMLILHNPETKETLVQTAQVRGSVDGHKGDTIQEFQ